MINLSYASFPGLKTARLILRQLAMDDEQEVFTLRSDSVINKYLDRQISKIEAFLHRDNKASITLLKSLSFKLSNEIEETNPDLICYYLSNSFDNLK